MAKVQAWVTLSDHGGANKAQGRLAGSRRAGWKEMV